MRPRGTPGGRGRFAASSILPGLVLFGLSFVAAPTAAAVPERVCVLGPNDLPLVGEIEGALRRRGARSVTATATTCSREVVTRFLAELDTSAAICADGDSVSSWRRDAEPGGRVVLVAIEPGGALTPADEAGRLADRAAEHVAPLVHEPPPESREPAPTAVAADRDRTAAPSSTGAAPARNAPRLAVGLGGGMTSSRDGSSFALSAEVAGGVGRWVTLSGWLSFVPENRRVDRPEGVASFRPTIFGLGIVIPFLPPTARIIPRIGGGYGLLWLHVAAERANAGATMRAPEDLLAPIVYGNLGLSFGVAGGLRVALEALAGTATHDMVIRFAGRNGAHWGVPLGGLNARVEWLFP